MSFESMEHEAAPICFGCHQNITSKQENDDYIVIKHRAGHSLRSIEFHAECFYAEAGDTYKQALAIKDLHDDYLKELERLNPDMLKDALDEVREDLRKKRELERKINELRKDTNDKLEMIHTYDNESCYNEWYAEELFDPEEK